MAAHVPALTWISVVHLLHEEAENQCRRIEVERIRHPLDDGFEQVGTASDGSHFDYALLLGGDTWLAVRQYADSYVAQIGQWSPAPVTLVSEQESAPAQRQSFSSWLASLFTEAPGVAIFLGTAAGAIGGALVGGAKGAAVGAGIGGGASLASVAVSNAEKSPPTAQVAQNMFGVLASAGLGGSAKRTAVKQLPAVRHTSSRADRFDKQESRADRFDRADYKARYGRPPGK